MPLPIGTLSSLQASNNEDEDGQTQQQQQQQPVAAADSTVEKLPPAPYRPASMPPQPTASDARDEEGANIPVKSALIHSTTQQQQEQQEHPLSTTTIPVNQSHSHLHTEKAYPAHNFPSIGQIQTSSSTQHARPSQLSSAEQSAASSTVQVPQSSVTYSQTSLPHIHSPGPSSGQGSPRMPTTYSASTRGPPQILESPSETSASGPGLMRKRRPYNASCDGCRTRKRKCIRGPDKDSWQCLNCSERGIACTFGNLGEPTRLRRADLEIQRLKGILDGITQSDNPEETEKLLKEYSEQHAGEPRKPGRPRGSPVIYKQH